MLTDYGKLHVAGAGYTELRPDGVGAAVREWRAALARGAALRVRGSGHGLSGGGVPRAGETLVRTRGLDHFRVESPGLVTVGSGAILWDVRDFVAERGWLLPVHNGGWAGPTLGGFVNAGGLGLRVPAGERSRLAPPGAPALDPVSLSERYGGLWAQVARLAMIDGRGRVHDILPGDADFPWMFAAMGQFGLTLEVTLRVLPAPGMVHRLEVGSSGRIPVSNPLDPNETDSLPPAHGIDWVYWFTALVPVDEEDAAWRVIGDWSRAQRGALRPTGGWVRPAPGGRADRLPLPGPAQGAHPAVAVSARRGLRRAGGHGDLRRGGNRPGRGRAEAGGAGVRRGHPRARLGALLPGGKPEPIARLRALLGAGALGTLLRVEESLRPRRPRQCGRRAPRHRPGAGEFRAHAAHRRRAAPGGRAERSRRAAPAGKIRAPEGG